MYGNDITQDDLRRAAAEARYSDFKLEDLILAVQEEVDCRVTFYPGQVKRGKLSPFRAIDKVAKMQAISDLLENTLKAKEEKPAGNNELVGKYPNLSEVK
jgi:hypothetical protein